MTTIPHSVISGVAYPVESVAGHPPTGLAQFLGETEFTVDRAGDHYLVRGCGSELDSQVRFHEKDEGMHHDIRVWHVTPADGGFSAEHIAAF